MDLVKILSEQYTKKELPEMNVGDTVRVLVKVKEGSRERTQAYEGVIIARKHGSVSETITVRRISYGVGLEKVFPVHSPSIDHIEVARHGDVRRAMERSQSRFFGLTVSDIMSRQPKTVSPTTRISDIEVLMHTHKIHSVLVADETGHLLGIVDSFRCAL